MYPSSIPNLGKEKWTTEDFFRKENKIVLAEISPHYSIGMHSHSFYELNIVLNGKGAHYFGNTMFEVNKGNTFIIPPNIKHGYLDGENLEVLNVLFHPNFFKKHLSELCVSHSFNALFRVEPLMRITNVNNYFLNIDDEQYEEIKVIIDLLFGCMSEATYSDITSDCYALLLIVKLCQIHEANKYSKVSDDKSDYYFAKSLTMIYEQYQEKITIESLCEIAHMSRSSYLNKFSNLFGTTPLKLLNSWRIEISKALLSNTAFSVTEIAQKTGFYDSSHFNRAFLSETKITPSEYRKTYER